MGKLKVYYNSSCPVCDAGIRGQRRRMQACADVEWVDIHRSPEALHEIGASQEFVRERLHVLDESGKLRVGASAFEALWSHTPGQVRLASLLRVRGIDKLAEWTYNLFARVLYKWNRANHRW